VGRRRLRQLPDGANCRCHGAPLWGSAAKRKGSHTLTPRRFQVLLTLFSKFFSSFVHTTCSLSVSEQYLAFAEVHQRFCAAFPNCATLGNNELRRIDLPCSPRDLSPLWQPFPERLAPRVDPGPSPLALQLQRFGFPPLLDSMLGLFPLHSPLLGKSQLFSFPVLIDMLKFSTLSCVTEVVEVFLLCSPFAD